MRISEDTTLAIVDDSSTREKDSVNYDYTHAVGLVLHRANSKQLIARLVLSLLSRLPKEIRNPMRDIEKVVRGSVAGGGVRDVQYEQYMKSSEAFFTEEPFKTEGGETEGVEREQEENAVSQV